MGVLICTSATPFNFIKKRVVHQPLFFVIHTLPRPLKNEATNLLVVIVWWVPEMLPSRRHRDLLPVPAKLPLEPVKTVQAVIIEGLPGQNNRHGLLEGQKGLKHQPLEREGRVRCDVVYPVWHL